MDILGIFEELLPIESPFFVDFISKDEENMEVTIHLGIEKSYRHTLIVVLFSNTTTENGNI